MSAGGANDAWLRRSLASVWHPCTQMKAHETLPLVPIARASGVWLEDFEGRRLLDAVSSWWVNLFGHGEPRIRAAITAQLGELEHAMLAGFTHRPAVELAERLSSLAPRGLGHAFFASDGASATEIALKMSYHAWRNAGLAGKRRFVGLAGGYHGETLGALAVTDVAIFRDAYAPIVRGGDTVPTPDARLARDGRTPADVAREAGDALEAYLAEHHDSVAALIVEPLVQGASGMVMYDASYLKRARALCTRYGVHLITDEIMTGFGRTGTLFACEQAGVVPDLMLLSKGITGGFLPLACRAALAVLDIFRDDDVIAANREKATRWDEMAAPLAAHAKVRDFRQRGMIVAFEVDTGRTDFARWCFAEGLARHLLLRPIGNTVYFMPPYVIDDDAFALLCERTREIVDLA